jgi:hypothetical protein
MCKEIEKILLESTHKTAVKIAHDNSFNSFNS